MRKLLLGLLMVCLAVSLSIPVFAGTVLDDAISNTSVTQSEGNDQLDIQRRGPYKAVVLYNGVNIRSGPGTQYPSYGHMNKGDMSRPRQHRHLKRKNSILFLVFLDFPHFFIHSGWQDTLF